MHFWSIADIADALEAGLTAEARRIEDEQAVHGLDALDELGLHPILHQSLRDHGYGVHPERRYPNDRSKRKKSHGERCDIVLTPDGRPLCEPDAVATLFDPADGLALDEAFWLEIKVVFQYGPEGPNRTYSTDLQTPIRKDLAKLAKDTAIRHAAGAIVLFSSDQTVADHDLGVTVQRLIERGIRIGTPYFRRVPIGDRLGHRLITVALMPVAR